MLVEAPQIFFRESIAIERNNVAVDATTNISAANDVQFIDAQNVTIAEN